MSQKQSLLGPSTTSSTTMTTMPTFLIRLPPILIPTRIDSRTLLKVLVGLNVILAIWLIASMGSTSSPTRLPQPLPYRNVPCVVIMNTSNSNIVVKESIPDRYELSQNVPQSSVNVVENEVPTDESKIPLQSQSQGQPIGPPQPSDTVDSDFDSKSIPQSPWWTTETHGPYFIINNYVIADDDVANDSITLTTQGSYEFLKHSVPLCQRWKGHVSIAVYAPGDDLKTSLELIYFLRRCRDSCVRNRVSWHVIFDSIHGPSQNNISYPDSIVLDYRSLSCNTSDDDAISFFVTWNKQGSSFRELNSLSYPINVVRNVARLQSRTKYLLASDIELYPSINIVSMFKDLIKREESGLIPIINSNVPHVYHLPIFEVKSGLDPPKTKKELREMFHKGDAIFFHKFVCDICQNFPDRNLWIDWPNNGSLNVFRVTKRTRQRSSWEPLYIGTNSEPFYDERLSWEGKRDKMSQMYEMCLMNYDLLVLDNAFLVHAPGIKKLDSDWQSDQQRRLQFIRRNNAIYNTILAKLRKKYANGPKHC